MDRHILRIRVDGRIWEWDNVAEEWLLIKHRLMGAYQAGVVEGWRDLPKPALTNKRARFYFTVRGWHEIGQHVYAAARQRGHVVSVLRRREPAASQVVYRDAWQVAILPRKQGRSPRDDHD
jgi:hypothetical protein